jgi:signal transduction histidine kinase
VLSAASHELRGPLGVARGYLRLLTQSGTLDARASRSVAEACRAADRMADLLDELSHYARWARGEFELKPAPTHLDGVLTAAAEAATLPETPAITVTTDTPAGLIAQVDSERWAAACAALTTSLARAQVAPVVLILAALADGNALEIALTPVTFRDHAADERPPDLDRSGTGLSVPLAELVIRLHGGRLTERWVGASWAGYQIRLA